MAFRLSAPNLGCLILAVLSGSSDLAAVPPARALTQYTRTVWTQAQGLPQDTIRAIAQTQDGYLWLGTNEGLVRFDGYDFVTYTTDDGALPNNAVTSLATGASGDLWVGTLDGLSRYSHGQFTKFTVKDGLPARPIIALIEDHAGILWVAVGGFLCKFQNGSFTTYDKASVAPVKAVQVVYEDAQQKLWVGGAGGLLTQAGGGFSAVLGPKDLGDNHINAILKDRRGVWLATGDKGMILVQTNGSLKRFDTTNGLSNTLVRAICEDRAGNLWVGTDGGVSHLENDRFVSSPLGMNDASEWIWSLFEDREGDLWVGTNSTLNRFRQDPFLVYGRAEGLPSDQPTVIHQDAQGEIWVGFHDGGLATLGGGKPRVYGMRDGLPSNEILGIRQSRTGDLLVATRRGLSRMQHGRFSNYPAPDPQEPSAAYDALEDSHGHLWIASIRGIYEWEVSHWREIAPIDYPITLAEGQDGNIWAGTMGTGSGWSGMVKFRMRNLASTPRQTSWEAATSVP